MFHYDLQAEKRRMGSEGDRNGWKWLQMDVFAAKRTKNPLVSRFCWESRGFGNFVDQRDGKPVPYTQKRDSCKANAIKLGTLCHSEAAQQPWESAF